MDRQFEKAETFRLGDRLSGWGESFVQQLVTGDPSLLGLGELVPKDKERRYIRGGKLDLLLEDLQEEPTRYCVEIQLGETDPSHIIRTIEYWDSERRRHPRIDHVAVIIAEEITSRFFNVIALFNQHIPLIAIKMSAVSLGEKKTILFTKVLDYASEIRDEEDAEYEATDRNYWQKRRPAEILQVVDSLAGLAKQVSSSIGLRYNKSSILLALGDRRGGMLKMWPQMKAVKMSLPCEQSGEIEQRLGAANIDYEGYDERRRRYVLRLSQDILSKHQALIADLISIVYSQSKQRDGMLEEE